MGKIMKYEVCLTDVVKGKVKICKRTKNTDIVEEWLSSRDQFPDRDWCYEEDKEK